MFFQYFQERVAYQKLLKAYNQIEAQYENSQDELNAMKNPHGSEMNFDRYVWKYFRVLHNYRLLLMRPLNLLNVKLFQ